MMKTVPDITIRICDTVELLQGCVDLQRSVFDLPEVEISPVRHFIVTMHAGGFTLGAFDGARLVGFCLSVPALLKGEPALYSHMTAVEDKYRFYGIGSRLKWAQRENSLARGIDLIKWTFQPEKSLNAYFNLEKLGAEVREYIPNFYGTDYAAHDSSPGLIPIQSDRLFALWKLDSPKVVALEKSGSFDEPVEYESEVGLRYDWNELIANDRKAAATEQLRIRTEFNAQLDKGLICRGFEKEPGGPRYLFSSD